MPGKNNVAADALPRSFFALSGPDLPRLSSRLLMLPLMRIHIGLESTKLVCKMQDLILFIMSKMVSYFGSPDWWFLIQTILEEFHSSILVGHSGIARTKARVAAQFFWSSLASDVWKFVSNCLVCQKAKSATSAPAGLLQPLPISPLLFGTIYRWILLLAYHLLMVSQL